MSIRKNRVIACMTATRADYPRVKSVLFEILKRPNLTLRLIVTGTHLLKEFGYTVTEIEKDGIPIDSRIEMYSEDDTPYGMAKAAAKCSDGIADALNNIRPDLFLLTVDRIETLATAQSAALMNFPIAHIQGGEVTGTIDESIRHAVTKMSHIHFPASIEAADRIIRMGENPEFVFPVGCPYIDIIRNLKFKSRKILARKYKFKVNKNLVLFTQHPVTTEYRDGTAQLIKSIDALKRFPDLEVVAIYSNADAGGRAMIDEMKKHPQFHIYPNISDSDYLSLMNTADLMIGNSSAGIREAPSFGLPVVNIGTRQNGRQRAGNVLDVSPDVKEIENAIKKSLYDNKFISNLKNIKNPYGDGHSAKRIVDILSEIRLTDDLLHKRIMY